MKSSGLTSHLVYSDKLIAIMSEPLFTDLKFQPLFKGKKVENCFNYVY